MKKLLILFLSVFTITLSGCEKDYACKDDPLGEACYIPMDDLDFQSTDPVEYTINENF